MATGPDCSPIGARLVVPQPISDIPFTHEAGVHFMCAIAGSGISAQEDAARRRGSAAG
jgi:hypothetical protein